MNLSLDLRSKTSSMKSHQWLVIAGIVSVLVAASGWGAFAYYQVQYQKERAQNQQNLSNLSAKNSDLSSQLHETQVQLDEVSQTDQVKRNNALDADLKNIKTTYKQAVTAYDAMIKLKNDAGRSQALETLFSKTLTYLAADNYASASAQLALLTKQTDQIQQQQAASVGAVPANVVAVNQAPGSGFRQQSVQSDVGTFVVDVLAADLNSTRVQVETASSGDCADGCPVASLSDYVSRSGGFAGINGPYFCPAEYPSCAGKTNSFDTLMMNKSKTYFNVANNVYSVVPAVVFSGSSATFYGQSAGVPHDGGYDAVIAAQPQVLSNGDVSFGGDGDPKKGSRGNRSFIGAAGSTVYIGVVHGATVAEVGHVLKTMGLTNALNLDSGGSVAFMANGKYVDGPGRQTPFGIVLVRK